jgi:hypothetical protein
MRNYTILLLLLGSLIQAQDIKLDDLKIPNSPALTLLDKSFSVAETVSSSGLINADLVNIKDNSVEVTPYWFFFKKDNKYFSTSKYYGIKYDSANDKFVTNPLHNVKKAAFSIAHAPSETLTTISFGLRANIICLDDSKNHIQRFKDYIKLRNDYLTEKPNGDGKTRLQNEIDQNGIGLAQAKVNLYNQFDASNVDAKKKIFKEADAPIFTLDFSAASSINFPGNKSDSGRLGRYGAWMSAKWSNKLNDVDKEYKNFLNLYGVSRLLYDATNFDAATDQYVEKNFLDIGGKLEFKFSNIGLSCEYINRNGDDKDFRLVGIIEYKINDKLILNGGYGKNFDVAEGNLVSLFGVKWSFNKESQIKYVID